LHFIHIFFSLKLLIFGDRMGTAENNHGLLSVAVNLGSPIRATENWLFSAVFGVGCRNNLFSAARGDRQNKPFSANFLAARSHRKYL
jgi:hypothetical protein